MKAFFDTSALVKRYNQEKESLRVDELFQKADSVSVSLLYLPEAISTLCRLRREGRVTHGSYVLCKQTLLDDFNGFVVCDLTEGVVTRCLQLLEENALQAADAVHIACALETDADLFVTADIAQAKAAKKAGLKVVEF